MTRVLQWSVQADASLAGDPNADELPLELEIFFTFILLAVLAAIYEALGFAVARVIARLTGSTAFNNPAPPYAGDGC